MLIEAHICWTGAYGVEHQMVNVFIENADLPRLQAECDKRSWQLRHWPVRGDAVEGILIKAERYFAESEHRREEDRRIARQKRATKQAASS